MDTFIEYMIAQKKTAKTRMKKTLIYIGALLASLFISFVVLVFVPSVISFIPMTIALAFYLAHRIGCNYDVEYEYTLTNGELDVDKITHKKKRKRLITIHCKSFIAFAKVGDENYKNEENGEFARVIDASAHSKTYEDYFAVFFKNGQKIKLVFNPTQKMLDLFKIYAPRVVK